MKKLKIIYLLLPLIFCSCGWKDAKEVIAMADSIDQNCHVIYEPSQSDKNNASMFYRNNQTYPHANPNAQLEIMYLGSDGELKTIGY